PATISETGGNSVLSGSGWAAPLLPAVAAELRGGSPGRALGAGIRPEHIDITSHPGGPCAQGRGTTRENPGDAAIGPCRVAPGETTVVVETPTAAHISIGDMVPLAFPSTALILFDAASGQNLLRDSWRKQRAAA